MKEESVGKSNVVLVAQVERDECTSMCDQFFDTAFNGRIASVMPRFSSPSVWKDDDKDVQIGIISGRSGSAKSAIATLYFGRPIHVINDVRWHSNISVCDHFSSSDVAKHYLDAVGLSDLRSPVFIHEMSDGEKSRASLARVLFTYLQKKSSEPLVIDEFTSLLDRETAVRVARGVRNLLSRESIRLVVVSCHEEFSSSNSAMFHALKPRWRYDCNLETCEHFSPEIFSLTEFEKTCNDKISIPQLSFHLVECDPSFWEHFRVHHYKSEHLSTKSRCFVRIVRAWSSRIF